ncbi:MAG TPA: polyprenol monophosphomannose synthase [Vicinamibacterales bacterium]|nr:polyprenol monophosphomannose synthase [Vicinamibacterales bacterium]
MNPPLAAGPPAADLTIVLPTYNERDRIAELVAALFSACAPHGIQLELVIVDDNSPDGTGAIADELARTHRIRVIHRAGKLGLGTAVVAGFEVASAVVVGVMDADFSHPPALVPQMLQTFTSARADLVVASRYVRGGSTPDWPLQRRLLSRAACLLARPLSPIRDAASGFFLIRRDIARGTTIKAGGFKICLELIVRSGATRLIEVPYRFDDREQGESKMSLREAAGYLIQLRDLYALRFAGGRPRRWQYQQVHPIAPER